MKQHFLYTDGGGFKPTIVKNPEAIEFLIIDLFCGAGGTSTGFTNAKIDGKNIALVMACVNHDPKAIKSHWLNHPEVIHFEEDIRTLELTGLVDIVLKYRLMYPNAKVILWASLECTNFSKAKGGQAREADSRTLADHLERYVTALSPDYIQIENVVEFMSWGPLDERGKPVSKKSGADWLRWCGEIRSLGYYDQWKEINSADFGAYTSRNRLFGCFAKHGLPIVWPEPTHSKKPEAAGLFGAGLQKWKPVKDVLDFEDEGISIFNRKKPLVDASLERIEAGLIKFVAGGKDNFILKYNSMAKNGDRKQSVVSTDNPSPTIPCQNRIAMCFISKAFSGKPEGKVIPITGPAGTITTVGGQSIVTAQPFICQRNSGDPNSKIISVESPARTLTATGGNQEICQPFIMNTNFKNVGNSIDEPAKTLLASRHYPYLVNPAFIAKYYGNGDNISSIEEPSGTLVTKDRFSKIQPVFIQREYKTATNTSIDEPIGSLLTVPKANLVKCDPFILNPSHGGHCTAVDVPCVVIVARQDKAPLYLIQFATENNVSVPIYDTDSPVMVRIKEFMALYGLSDIKMRMLKVPELLLIQGFDKDYQLFGNQTDQKKFIGNSVHPKVPEHWCITFTKRLREIRAAA